MIGVFLQKMLNLTSHFFQIFLSLANIFVTFFIPPKNMTNCFFIDFGTLGQIHPQSCNFILQNLYFVLFFSLRRLVRVTNGLRELASSPASRAARRRARAQPLPVRRARGPAGAYDVMTPRPVRYALPCSACCSVSRAPVTSCSKRRAARSAGKSSRGRRRPRARSR